ncbi:MAG: DUF4147 domain-containing protein [Patescibacteria group bacterium]|nr:DUF4147 domain-containing protein [Patescibacteria group bacterium]
MHTINFKKLAKTSLRKKALLTAEAGYEAINIKKSIFERIKINNGVLEINYYDNEKPAEILINLKDYKRVFLIGVGKGSALASAYLAKVLGEKFTKGIALDVKELQTINYKLQTFIGTHPLPSKKNIAATEKIVKLLKDSSEKDLVIFFICGGGSALLCGFEEEMKGGQKIFKELTAKGADILELNTIRKHLSGVKGGNLAKIAYPATILSLIVSDVIGNNLSMVASGPTVLDNTSKSDAEKILRKYNLQPTADNLKLTETPKDKKFFRNVKNVLFMSNYDAVNAMAKKAKELGLKPKIISLTLKGEAKNIFSRLAKNLKSGEAVLGGGETTVILNQKSKIKNQKSGIGGRNQEAALAALMRLTTLSSGQATNHAFFGTGNQPRFLRDRQPTTNNFVFLSLASDGNDNNTGAAGAIGDYLTLKNAKNLKLNPKQFLENHDSFNFFRKTGDLVFADKKGFNVADFMIISKE